MLSMINYESVYGPKNMLRECDEHVKKCSKIVTRACPGTFPLVLERQSIIP
jgi:hypothetical protein